MVNINLGLPGELLAQVDHERGDVARTKWIVRAIEQRLARATDPEMIPVPHRPGLTTMVRPPAQPTPRKVGPHAFESIAVGSAKCRHCDEHRADHRGA